MNAALVMGGLLLAFLLYGLIGNALSSGTEPEIASRPTGAPGNILQVEVRNASGVDGAARRVTLYLRQQGFDVVEVGNAPATQANSAVIDRAGDLPAARHTALVLGIPEGQIQQEIRPELMLDVSVIIGEDHERLKPFGNE